MNLLRWGNLIGSLPQDIWQYPMIEISNLGSVNSEAPSTST